MKKIHRHEACSMSQPPSTGPSAVMMEVKPDHVPMARPRVLSSKVAPVIERLPGPRNAAPMPSTDRAAISCSILVESPQAPDAAVNSPPPDRNIHRLPKESP